MRLDPDCHVQCLHTRAALPYVVIRGNQATEGRYIGAARSRSLIHHIMRFTGREQLACGQSTSRCKGIFLGESDQG